MNLLHMRMSRYNIWVCLLGLLAGCKADNSAPAPDAAVSGGVTDTAYIAHAKAPSRMAFDQFTTDDGLADNTLYCMFEDNKGFLWFGTSKGLNRYDGYSFTTYAYEPGNPQSLLENDALYVCEDSKGHIWVLGFTGLTEIDPVVGTTTTYTDSLFKSQLDEQLQGMVADRHDVLWINGSPLAFDTKSKRFVAPDLPMGLPYQFATDGHSTVFGVGADFEYQGLQRSRTVIARQERDNPMRMAVLRDTVDDSWSFKGNTLLVYDDRYLFFCEQHGILKRYDLQEDSFIDHVPRVGSLKWGHISKGSHVLWLAGWGGIGRLDLTQPLGSATQRYTHDERDPRSLPVRSATRILEDRNGNLWVGTLNAGLCRYAPTQHKFEHFAFHFPDTAGLPGRVVEALCFDRDDRLWVGTNKGLCRLENRRDAVFKSFRQNRNAVFRGNVDVVKVICEDRDAERLYIGYWGMPPDYFDMRKERHAPLPIARPHRAANGKFWTESYLLFTTAIRMGSNGDVYYSDFGYFLLRYDPRKQQMSAFCIADEETRGDSMRSVGYHHLTASVWPASPSSVWLGTVNKSGLIKVDLSAGNMFGVRVGDTITNAVCTPPYSGTMTFLKADNGVPGALQSGLVKCFFEDSYNRLWLGTDLGLHLLQDRENDVFKCYNEANGFPNAHIQAILEDDRGRLWVSTSDGICCFDPESERVIAHYGVEDGLQGRQFSQNAAAKNSWGLMAFGGLTGLNIFHPDSLLRSNRVPTVALSGFEVNGMVHGWSENGVRLSHREKNVAFEFAVMDFSNPKHNQYQFYLEGYDTGWCTPTPIRSVRYTNLPAGSYTFRVRGCNADGVWSQRDLLFPVRIAAPWWATVWFRALAGLMAFGGILLLVRYREARMRAKLREDERIIRYLQVQTLQAQMNPHFIFNVLGVMQHQIIKSKPQEANRQLGNLSTLIRRFLDASVSSAPVGKGMSQTDIPLEEEIELLTMYAEFEVLQRQEKFEGNGFSVEVDDAVQVSTVRIPPMIIQPYIENAVKHGIRYLPEGRRGFVRIRFDQKNGALRCTVEDNGVGRTEAERIQGQSHSIYKSHGTRLVRERIEILNQIGYDISIQTTDRPGGGTLVTINIKD
jgi:ligand-binding sensor domain-containing protein